MPEFTTPPRTRVPWFRLGQRLRCWLVSYASVAAITMELLSEKPAATATFDPPPFVAAARETRLSDCWDSAEILEGSPLRVILTDAPSADQPTGASTVLYRN